MLQSVLHVLLQSVPDELSGADNVRTRRSRSNPHAQLPVSSRTISCSRHLYARLTMDAWLGQKVQEAQRPDRP